jgi:hypothetical protein
MDMVAKRRSSDTRVGDQLQAYLNLGVNLVRSRAGDAWPDVQERVQEINAKLDAGQWSELGLGS